jgi:hypothetical protein
MSQSSRLIRFALSVVFATPFCGVAAEFEGQLAAVAVARAIGPDPDDAKDDDPRVVALRAQMEPLLKTELSFANRVCQWTDEQRIKSIGVAKAWLSDFARGNARNNAQLNGGFVIFAGGGRGGGANNDVANSKSELAHALQNAMTGEQLADYQAERKKRNDFHTDATIANIVAQMDQRLQLTVDQRRKISESLRQKWRDEWAPPIQLFVQLPQYAPAFPDEHVLGHLSPEQRLAWQQVQKISARGMAFGEGMFGGRNEPIDDIDLTENQ